VTDDSGTDDSAAGDGGAGDGGGTHGGGVLLRRATEADAGDIARVHMDSRAATMPYLPPQRRGHDEVTAWVRDLVLPRCPTWVAVRGGHLVGYAVLDGDLLDHLYLRPDALRQGIGTLLLDEVRRHSPAGLTLHVFAQNAQARAFYAAHGFEVVASTDGSGNMEHLPDLTLRWTP
jgi:GNAT superfamily N-acetyltransferase